MKEALIELFPFKHGMNWMAVDEDGSVYQYSKEPWPNTNGEWDINDYSTQYDKLGLVSPPQDWTNTLVKRKEWKLSEEQVTELCRVAESFIFDAEGDNDLTGRIHPAGIHLIINMYESFKPKA